MKEIAMSSPDQHHEGGCYCGAIRYRISRDPVSSAHCHCRSCQLALGAAFATWAKVPAAEFRFVQGAPKFCEKTPGIRRGFCGDCGTSLTYAAAQDVDGQDWSGDAWFSAATLDDPSIVAPRSHVYTAHRQPWIVPGDGLPEFTEF